MFKTVQTFEKYGKVGYGKVLLFKYIPYIAEMKTIANVIHVFHINRHYALQKIAMILLIIRKNGIFLILINRLY